MLTRNGFKTLSVLFWFMPVLSHAAIVSRVTTFSDGSVLFASDLNSEFNNLVNNINALDNDNIIAGAAIAPSKISGTIAGDGLVRNGATGALSVNVDDVTLDTSSNQVIVKTNGVGNAQLRQSVAVSVVGRSANSTGDVADIAAGANSRVLKREADALVFDTVDSADITDGTIATADIADGAVTQAKRVALGQQISGGSGTFSTTSGSATDVTSLSVTLTTTGRPIYVGLIGDLASTSNLSVNSTTTANAVGTVRLVVDGSTISRGDFGHSLDTIGARARVPCSSMWGITTKAAGTYTIKAQANVNGVESGANTTVNVDNCKLVAYEL